MIHTHKINEMHAENVYAYHFSKQCRGVICMRNCLLGSNMFLRFFFHIALLSQVCSNTFKINHIISCHHLHVWNLVVIV